MSNIIKTNFGTNRERPKLEINNKLYEVDNRKKTFDKYNKEMKKLQKEGAENGKIEELLLETFLGKENAKELLSDEDMTVEEYADLTFYVLSAVTGKDVNELKDNAMENLKI